MQDLSLNELAQTIKDGAVLIDVRTPQEFSEAHVDGSVNIPLDMVAVEQEQFVADKPVIVYCRSGMRSAQAKAILAQYGISVINGGGWEFVQEAVNLN